MKRTKLPEHGDLRVGGGGGHACVKLCHRCVEPGQNRGGVNGQIDKQEDEEMWRRRRSSGEVCTWAGWRQ